MRLETKMMFVTYSSREVQPTLDLYYLLTRERKRKVIIQPRRYDHVDLILYALNVDGILQDSNPNNFKDEFKIK